jgi:2,3-diaminopropionate biosynthesis protein SbnA
MRPESKCDAGVLDAIGRTPLIRLSQVFESCHFTLYGKWEALNPGGSIKDRAALSMLRQATAEGLVGTNTTVIESSSGNMAIGMAMACAYLRVPFICVIDPKTTQTNISILRAYGAQIELVSLPDPATGEFLPERIRRVQSILHSRPDVLWMNQYANPNNALAHHGTMREIVESLGKPPDYLLCATSTCGTLRGCSDYIKMNGLPTHVLAVDAAGSAIFNSSRCKRLLPGMGSARVPELFAPDLAERCIHVTDLDCIVGCRRLVRREAILAGASSGGVLSALDRFKASIPNGATCVLILCDRGERYLDTIYSDEWVFENFNVMSDDLAEEVRVCATTY